jgi:hypothetical protein
MENSPLRFLDYDISLMLADQVRISHEEEARRFHSNNFVNSHENDLNQDNHYLLSSVFDTIYYNIQNNPRELTDSHWAIGKIWFDLSIHHRVCIFEEERCEEEQRQYCSDRSWYNYVQHLS